MTEHFVLFKVVSVSMIAWGDVSYVELKHNEGNLGCPYKVEFKNGYAHTNDTPRFDLYLEGFQDETTVHVEMIVGFGERSDDMTVTIPKGHMIAIPETISVPENATDHVLICYPMF